MTATHTTKRTKRAAPTSPPDAPRTGPHVERLSKGVTIPIAGPDGATLDAPAYARCGGLAATQVAKNAPPGAGATITHIRTGLALAYAQNSYDAEQAMRQLAALNWEFDTIAAMPESTRERARVMIADFQARGLLMGELAPDLPVDQPPAACRALAAELGMRLEPSIGPEGGWVALWPEEEARTMIGMQADELFSWLTGSGVVQAAERATSPPDATSAILTAVEPARPIIAGDVLMGREEARQAADRIRSSLGDLRVLIDDFDRREGWKALDFDSFRAWALSEIDDTSLRHVYRLRDAAEVDRSLGVTIGHTPESHARILKAVEPADRPAVIERADRIAGSAPRQARHIEQAIQDMRDLVDRAEALGATVNPIPDGHGRYTVVAPDARQAVSWSAAQLVSACDVWEAAQKRQAARVHDAPIVPPAAEQSIAAVAVTDPASLLAAIATLEAYQGHEPIGHHIPSLRDRLFEYVADFDDQAYEKLIRRLDALERGESPPAAIQPAEQPGRWPEAAHTLTRKINTIMTAKRPDWKALEAAALELAAAMQAAIAQRAAA